MYTRQYDPAATEKIIKADERYANGLDEVRVAVIAGHLEKLDDAWDVSDVGCAFALLLAEQVRLRTLGEIQDKTETPYKKRGILFLD